MVTSVAARSQVVDSPALERALRLVPGLALLFAIGYAGKYVESWIRAYGTSRHLSLPNIEYVLAAAVFFAARAGRRFEGSRAQLVWSKFPKFVLGFLLLSTLASAHLLGASQIGSLANLSRWAFLLTFAGVGLRTNFVDLRRQGLRPLVVGALAEIGIAAPTLAMVSAADSTFGL